MPRFSARRTSLIGCLAALALCGVFAGAAAAAKDAPVVLVLGDSLSAAHGMPRSQGWVSLLQQRLQNLGRPWRVVNGSISGDTTGQALKRLPRLLAEHRPRVVIIELGGNDGLQGKPLPDIRANLSGLVAGMRAAGARAVLVGMRIPPNYGEFYRGQFEQLYQEVAQRENVPLLRFNLEEIALADGMMQPDGIHPAPRAQSRMLDALWPKLNAELLEAERRGAAESPDPG